MIRFQAEDGSLTIQGDTFAARTPFGEPTINLQVTTLMGGYASFALRESDWKSISEQAAKSFRALAKGAKETVKQ